MGFRSAPVSAMFAVVHRRESFLPLPLSNGESDKNMPPPPQLSLSEHTQMFSEKSGGHVLAPQSSPKQGYNRATGRSVDNLCERSSLDLPHSACELTIPVSGSPRTLNHYCSC